MIAAGLMLCTCDESEEMYAAEKQQKSRRRRQLCKGRQTLHCVQDIGQMVYRSAGLMCDS